MFLTCSGWHLKVIGSSRGALQKTLSLQSGIQEPLGMAPKTLISFGTQDSSGPPDSTIMIENAANNGDEI